MRIAVLFAKRELTEMRHVITAGSVVISDFDAKWPEGVRHVKARVSLEQEVTLAREAREFFTEAGSRYGEMTKAFANNFFECAILPLARYLHSLRDVVNERTSEGDDVEVWFAHRVLWRIRSSAYFMAEHESQGVTLYRRELVFLPYMLDLCSQYAVKVKFNRIALGASMLVSGALRRWAVFLARFVMALKAVERLPQRCEGPRNYDFLAVTRSCGQTEFLWSFVAASKSAAKVLVAETFLGRGRNWRVSTLVRRSAPQCGALKIGETSYRRVLADYLRAARIVTSCPPARFEVCGVGVDLRQALAETIAMLPDLQSYHRALVRGIRQEGRPRIPALLSTEQKSPHAYVDALAASECGLRCIQLMQCDQYANALPFPVFGDYFLADTQTKAEAFRQVWPDDREKVKYIGSVKACVSWNRLASDASSATWCFFTNPDDREACCQVLEVLDKLQMELGTSIIVKLHPRDFRSKYARFTGVRFVGEGDMERIELFSSFSHAITFPSGIVLDLLYAAKPFVLLAFGPGVHLEQHIYADGKYAGVARGVESLAAIMSDVPAFEKDFLKYRQRFLSANRVVSDVSVIKRALENLVSS